VTNAEYAKLWPIPSTPNGNGKAVGVTCERPECRFRHTLERKFTEPAVIHIVCHGCEAILRTEFP
jgi:hypothetical protein